MPHEPPCHAARTHPPASGYIVFVGGGKTLQAMPIVMQLVLNFPQKMLAKELAALAVNLSLNPRNAQMMASQRGLPHLVERVTETKDPLLMKVRR